MSRVPAEDAAEQTEAVEAGLLREHRRNARHRLADVRRFVDLLSEKFGAPYPAGCSAPICARASAWARPANRRSARSRLVAVANDQLLLTLPLAELRRARRVDR